jgi:hypothetical protein
MTGTTAQRRMGSTTAMRALQLALALTVGAVLGSIATIQLIDRADAPAAIVPEAVTPETTVTTTATEQYVGWFTRPAEGAAAWEAATRQYVDWFTRRDDLAGSTATEQYMNWYLRDYLPQE